ncbi:MAG: hypothetical protein ACYC40_04965 [Patescibacteria group bacterium]
MIKFKRIINHLKILEMPVLIVYGISEPMSRKLEEFTDTLIDTVAYAVDELKLQTSDVSVFYPKDWMPKGLGEELIIFVDGLFDKPERTEEVRHKLADAIVETANNFFPKIRLIECFVRPFDLKQGYSSRRLISKIKKSDFPKLLEIGGHPKEELIHIILDKGCTIAPQALSLISHEGFVTSTEKKIVKLCRKTVAEMGFIGEWTPWSKIKTWIEEHGQLCDNELSLRLRILYREQPVDEELFVANKFQFFRITNFNGEKSVFRNGTDGFQSSLILSEDDTAEDDTAVYCLYNEFVYCEK